MWSVVRATQFRILSATLDACLYLLLTLALLLALALLFIQPSPNFFGVTVYPLEQMSLAEWSLSRQCHIHKRSGAVKPPCGVYAIPKIQNLARGDVLGPYHLIVMYRLHIVLALKPPCVFATVVELAAHEPQVALAVVRLVIILMVAL